MLLLVHTGAVSFSEQMVCGPPHFPGGMGGLRPRSIFGFVCVIPIHPISPVFPCLVYLHHKPHTSALPSPRSTLTGLWIPKTNNRSGVRAFYGSPSHSNLQEGSDTRVCLPEVLWEFHRTNVPRRGLSHPQVLCVCCYPDPTTALSKGTLPRGLRGIRTSASRKSACLWLSFHDPITTPVLVL